MVVLKKDNVTLKESDKGKIKELQLMGFKIQEPKKETKKDSKKK